MHKVQESSDLYHNAYHPAICNICHFTHIWKTLTSQHHFTRMGIWAHKEVYPPSFLLKSPYQAMAMSGRVYQC